MKKHLNLIVVAVLGLSLIPVCAQMGGAAPGPGFSGSMAKLFGDNTAFSASIETQVKSPDGDTMIMPGKIAYDTRKSRVEVNMADMKGGKMPPGTVAHMKSMGMDNTVAITRPDKKTTYLIYPGLQAYAEAPIQDPTAVKSPSDFKIETT
jgi:hypothetical protein